MTVSSEAKVVAHDFKSMANILRLIAKKYPASADGFEEFQVRGSALRHMGVSVEHMADQFELAAQAFLEEIPSGAASNMNLVGSLFEGCSFQLSHFGLSLKSDHHHMVPMCGAHNPRSPIAEAGFLWRGVSKVATAVSEHTQPINDNLSAAFGGVAESLEAFSDGVGLYREAMEESRFAEAAERLGQASRLLSDVAMAVNNVSPELRNL